MNEHQEKRQMTREESVKSRCKTIDIKIKSHAESVQGGWQRGGRAIKK